MSEQRRSRKDARSRFIFLRMYPHESDFRFALAEALYEIGFDATYIDARFDFDLLRGIAALLPQTQFYVYGYVGGEEIKAILKALTDERPNIIYTGPYQNSDIPKVLADFSMMLAPYQHNHLTRYIDPLRFCHGLRSGMEVVSTSIPAVKTMSDLIHGADNFAEELISGGNYIGMVVCPRPYGQMVVSIHIRLPRLGYHK